MLEIESESDDAIFYKNVEKGHFFLNPFWKIFYVLFMKKRKQFKVMIFFESAIYLDTQKEVEDYINSYDKDGRIIYDYSAKHNIPIQYREERKLKDIIEYIEGKISFSQHNCINGGYEIFYDKKEIILMNKIISFEILENFISSLSSNEKIEFLWPYEKIETHISIRCDGYSTWISYEHLEQLLQKMKEFK